MNLNKLRPQQKLVSVNNRIGNDYIKQQQGTTKQIYDTVEFQTSANNQVLNLFIDAKQRSFPKTNFDNQLISGDALALQRISFAIVVTTDEGVVTVYTIEDFIGSLAGTENLKLGEFSIKINTDTVMKPIRLLHTLPEFNKNALNEVSNIFEFNTDLVLPPQLDFELTVKLPPLVFVPVPGSTYEISATIEGVGAQLNLKSNM